MCPDVSECVRKNECVRYLIHFTRSMCPERAKRMCPGFYRISFDSLIFPLRMEAWKRLGLERAVSPYAFRFFKLCALLLRSHFRVRAGRGWVSVLLPVLTNMAELKLCRLCGLEHAATEGRMHGPAFTCTTCWAAKAMLERNLGSRTDLQDFSQSETHAFFRAIAKVEKAKAGGTNSVGHRACLTDSTHYRSQDLYLSCHVHKERVAAERVAQPRLGQDTRRSL